MPEMNRRRILACGVAFATGNGGARASLDAIDFVPLKETVRVPLAAIADPWKPAFFKARFARPNGADAVAPGMALRIPSGVVAFCTYCPHELCIVAFDETSREFECPCHGGRFDPQRGGARLSGPPPRSAYQFQHHVTNDDLEIIGVEAELRRRLQ
ncbi:ubiquinol-cytochrome c reductase iron-sulfur subunit [Bradyrhizobium liaoningense]|uniref:QcrA and Rieske domain-containing protein n=1 Tax=Bradyrhizobium liaoningense TaxID=43992 RepID=UPI001BA6E311|nr:Rieske 2Fe-2S domain-containing protein [Bradyrhizobium liaoningense]MBR0858054.1 Rieske 2Fe-2S domain-containing protein [Bradyrhizobium liaoningense]